MTTLGGVVTYSVGIISILIGIVLFTAIPKQLGLYRFHATIDHSFVGFTPAHLYNIPYGFTINELYSLNLTGQTAIVTGANSGIGYAIAEALYTLGADVTMTCRDTSKCNTAAESIRTRATTNKRSNDNGSIRRPIATLTTMVLDTNSLSSVRDFSLSYMNNDPSKSLDMLFLNAGGVGYIDKVNKKCIPTNDDTIEITFATNYVGHHLLFRYMQPLLERSKLARVVSTSSNASYRSYTYKVATNLTSLNGCLEPYEKNGVHLAYGQSKLAQIIWTEYIATKLLPPSSSIYVNAFHPGIVATQIFEKAFAMVGAPKFLFPIIDWFKREVFWTSLEGALTGLYLGTNVDALVKQNIRGRYYHPQSIPILDHPYMNDTIFQEQLWNFTEELVKDYLPVSHNDK
jgi:NAD(P)-dependent dehydrogenase (short-subunit alcohol dehydrogenase family)